MAEVVLVSKPLAPPWSDSNKNLARDLARHVESHQLHVLTASGVDPGIPDVIAHEVYGGAGDYAPALAQNARVFAFLGRPGRCFDLYHFFFAPNRTTSLACSALMRLKRSPSIQTVVSAPRSFERIEGLLFTDRVVALSQYSYEQLSKAVGERVVHIPPGIVPPEPVEEARAQAVRDALGLPPDGPILLFPGDYEEWGGCELFLKALPDVLREVEVRAVLACRTKTAKSREAEDRMKERVRTMGLEGRVVFAGEVPDMEALISLCSLAALPARSYYGKMDLPMVLLECLAQGVPIVVTHENPMNDLIGVGAATVHADRWGDLSEWMLRFLKDRELAERVGAAGREAVRTQFAASTMARRYEALYDELLAERRSS